MAHYASDLDQRRRAMIQQINASKFIPADEKRFYIQNVMSGSWTNATDMMKEVKEADHMYQDMQPTYADAGRGVFGCEHYERSCKIKCPTCARMFACHKCHDKEVTSHSMDRFSVQSVMCMGCGIEQGVGVACTSGECDEDAAPFGKHFCLSCRMYSAKEMYHCDKCDVCRVGVAADYVHCDKCNVCIQQGNFAKHKCVQDSHNANCPICHDSMGSKQCSQSVVVTICGHPMHEDCLNAYVGHGNFKCPVCMHVLGDMSQQFRQLEQLVSSQPMPAEYAAARATIQCVCCSQVSVVPFHFVGHQCPTCMSFNTSIVGTDGLPDQPAPVVEENNNHVELSHDDESDFLMDLGDFWDEEEGRDVEMAGSDDDGEEEDAGGVCAMDESE